MNTAAWTIAFLTAICSCVVHAEGQDSANTLKDRTSKPGWSIETTVSPKAPRLSDSIYIEFVVESEPGLTLKDPELIVAPDDFIVQRPLEQTEFSSGNRRVFQAVVAPIQAGETTVPRLAIPFTNSSDSTNQNRVSSQGIMASPMLKMEILTDPDSKDLAAILSTDLETVPDKANVWLTWGLPILGAVVVLLLGLVGYAARGWFLNRPAKPETPEGLANRLLDCLSAEKLPEQGRFQEFYSRLTGIVREFIAQKTGLHAPELTTEEFWHAAQQSPYFSMEWSQTLRDFLASADLVKFGGQKPDQAAIEKAISTARESIHRVASSSAAKEGGS